MKHIVKFANTTNTSGETINEPVSDITTGAPTWSGDKISYSKMDVAIVVNTLSGTNPTLTVKVNEKVSGTAFATTAISKALSATGTYLLCQGASPTGQMSVLSDGAFWSLGKGTDKQIITTIGGTCSAVNADIYLIFYEDK